MLGATLAASLDPGIGRWLGFVDVDDGLQGATPGEVVAYVVRGFWCANAKRLAVPGVGMATHVTPRAAAPFWQRRLALRLRRLRQPEGRAQAARAARDRRAQLSRARRQGAARRRRPAGGRARRCARIAEQRRGNRRDPAVHGRRGARDRRLAAARGVRRDRARRERRQARGAQVHRRRAIDRTGRRRGHRAGRRGGGRQGSEGIGARRGLPALRADGPQLRQGPAVGSDDGRVRDDPTPARPSAAACARHARERPVGAGGAARRSARGRHRGRRAGAWRASGVGAPRRPDDHLAEPARPGRQRAAGGGGPHAVVQRPRRRRASRQHGAAAGRRVPRRAGRLVRPLERLGRGHGRRRSAPAAAAPRRHGLLHPGDVWHARAQRHARRQRARAGAVSPRRVALARLQAARPPAGHRRRRDQHRCRRRQGTPPDDVAVTVAGPGPRALRAAHDRDHGALGRYRGRAVGRSPNRSACCAWTRARRITSPCRTRCSTPRGPTSAARRA